MGSYNAVDLCTQQMASTGCKKIVSVLVDLGERTTEQQKRFPEVVTEGHATVLIASTCRGNSAPAQ